MKRNSSEFGEERSGALEAEGKLQKAVSRRTKDPTTLKFRGVSDRRNDSRQTAI